ncbi:hypothetical protein H6P81_007600 [Aristolochia fimbriata]|uniref:Uncharacterized protein n=1 Tax=Aristolochia fimbriata TaxID=158543 RepID=A0AAV7F4E4_ARIFI|nr:hypothetical protein H6P81_007600 [Aristolochia fimbriata]
MGGHGHSLVPLSPLSHVSQPRPLYMTVVVFTTMPPPFKDSHVAVLVEFEQTDPTQAFRSGVRTHMICHVRTPPSPPLSRQPEPENHRRSFPSFRAPSSLYKEIQDRHSVLCYTRGSLAREEELINVGGVGVQERGGAADRGPVEGVAGAAPGGVGAAEEAAGAGVPAMQPGDRVVRGAGAAAAGAGVAPLRGRNRGVVSPTGPDTVPPLAFLAPPHLTPQELLRPPLRSHFFSTVIISGSCSVVVLSTAVSL